MGDWQFKPKELDVFYAALFDALFVPTSALLSSQVHLYQEDAIPLGEMIHMLARDTVRSLVLHFRAGDSRSRHECQLKHGIQNTSYTPLVSQGRECMETLIRNETLTEGGSTILLLLSDATCTLKQTYQWVHDMNPKMMIWFPTVTGPKQIDSRLVHNKADAAEGLKETLRDLLLMRYAKIIIRQDDFDGFAAASSIISLKRQQIWNYKCVEDDY